MDKPPTPVPDDDMTKDVLREGEEEPEGEKGEEEPPERARSRSPVRRPEENKAPAPKPPPLPARVPRPWDEVAEVMNKGFTEPGAVDLGSLRPVCRLQKTTPIQLVLRLRTNLAPRSVDRQFLIVDVIKMSM